MGELHPQSPQNELNLNHVLVILIFLNVNIHEQSSINRFWHDGIKVTFIKVKWKEYTRLLKDSLF